MATSSPAASILGVWAYSAFTANWQEASCASRGYLSWSNVCSAAVSLCSGNSSSKDFAPQISRAMPKARMFIFIVVFEMPAKTNEIIKFKIHLHFIFLHRLFCTAYFCPFVLKCCFPSAFGIIDSITTNIIQPKQVFTPDDILLYPNPAQETINISINTNQQQTKFHYRIIDMYGHVAKEGLFTTNEIDISSLSNGVYQFQVQSKTEQVGRRFLVIKYR